MLKNALDEMSSDTEDHPLKCHTIRLCIVSQRKLESVNFFFTFHFRKL